MTTNTNTNNTQPTRVTSADDLLARYAAGERDFYYANLYRADLSGATLSGADLSGATLSGANLSGADLSGANLYGANLYGANLYRADLSGADLSGATLSGADLSGATLSGADLSGADLDPIRDNLFGYLEHVPDEVASLLMTLEAGRIDGTTYDGPCACLAGTCEKLVRGADDTLPRTQGDLLAEVFQLRQADSPRERWFLAIRPGDTPENSPVAAITAGWLREWLAARPSTSTAATGEAESDEEA